MMNRGILNPMTFQTHEPSSETITISAQVVDGSQRWWSLWLTRQPTKIVVKYSSTHDHGRDYFRDFSCTVWILGINNYYCVVNDTWWWIDPGGSELPSYTRVNVASPLEHPIPDFQWPSYWVWQTTLTITPSYCSIKQWDWEIKTGTYQNPGIISTLFSAYNQIALFVYWKTARLIGDTVIDVYY